MNPDFEFVLEDCLARLRAGEDLAQCLSRYPAQADRLTPLLLAASHVGRTAVPQPRLQAVQAGRERLLAALNAQTSTEATPKSPVSSGPLRRYLERISTVFHTVARGKETQMKFALRLAIDFVVMSVIGGALAVNASGGTLPGDPLYAVKRAWEDTRLTFTLDPLAYQDLQSQLNAERLQEVQNMIQLHRTGTVQFEGELQAMTTSLWQVGNLPMAIQPNTVIEGTPQVGQMVWVQAEVQNNGMLVAVRMSPALHLQNLSPYPPPMPSQMSNPSMSSPTRLPMHTAMPTQRTELMQTAMPTQGAAPMNTARPTQMAAPMNTAMPPQRPAPMNSPMPAQPVAPMPTAMPGQGMMPGASRSSTQVPMPKHMP